MSKFHANAAVTFPILLQQLANNITKPPHALSAFPCGPLHTFWKVLFSVCVSFHRTHLDRAPSRAGSDDGSPALCCTVRICACCSYRLAWTTLRFKHRTVRCSWVSRARGGGQPGLPAVLLVPWPATCFGTAAWADPHAGQRLRNMGEDAPQITHKRFEKACSAPVLQGAFGGCFIDSGLGAEGQAPTGRADTIRLPCGGLLTPARKVLRGLLGAPQGMLSNNRGEEQTTNREIPHLSGTAEQVDKHLTPAGGLLPGARPAAPHLRARLRRGSGRGCGSSTHRPFPPFLEAFQRPPWGRLRSRR